MENLALNTQVSGNREKKWVALTSVFAAVFLTVLKLIVGLITGSLGILSEAAHSGLDLAAAVMTFFAVRLSDRPADSQYTYGYGKVENLSALFETALLFVTCVWIVYEAIVRLFFRSVEIDVNVWSFLIMGVSIIVDIGRSKTLSRAAKKYKSQALEADALHFSTDIWSSSVVIGGLILVYVSRRLDILWLAKADAVAAIGVAGIVIYVSVQLGKKTIAALLDAIPSGLRDEVLRAVQVGGVMEVSRVRLRKSGPETFADISLKVARDISFEQAQEIASSAEAQIRQVLPNADVLIYLAPERRENEGILSTIRGLAGRLGLEVHSIRIYENGSSSRSLEMHMEISELFRLDEAHERANRLEKALHESPYRFDQIVIHIEPAGDKSAIRQAILADEIRILQTIEQITQEENLDCRPHDLKVYRSGEEISVSFHCILDGDLAIGDAHHYTELLERRLRGMIPELGRVVIHTEPMVKGNLE